MARKRKSENKFVQEGFTSQQPPDREGSEAFLLFFSYDAVSDARRLQSSNATKI